MDSSPELRVLTDQLGRMRGMTRLYHERFFSDTRFTTVAILALFTLGWWQAAEAFLLVPVVALMGANQTAFDASYLYFARHYATRLETEINRAVGREVLVAAKLENAYLFPLSARKIVAVAGGGGFSWFGWITVFYTLLGAGAFAAGLALGWEVLRDAGTTWTVAYLSALAVLMGGSLLCGMWWFVAGTGERRLERILDETFE